MKNVLMMTAAVAGLALFAGAGTAEAGGCYRGGGYGYRAPGFGYGAPAYSGFRGYGYRGYGYAPGPYRGFVGRSPYHGGYGYGGYGYNRRGGVNVRVGW